MTTWAAIAAIGVGTYLTRLSFIGLFGRRPVPRMLETPLRFVAPAALAALTVPAFVAPGGGLDLTPGNLRLVAGIAAGLVAWRTRTVGLPILVGLVGLALLEAVV
ncbi:MAG: AzlD domain-containing protein [Acidimicrobiia bacterium]